MSALKGQTNIVVLHIIGLTPTKGLTKRTGLEGNTMVTAGPMCRYAQDLLPFLQVLVGNNISRLQLDAEVHSLYIF